MKVGYADRVFGSAVDQFERAAKYLHEIDTSSRRPGPPHTVKQAQAGVTQAIESLRILGHDDSQALGVREAALGIVMRATDRTAEDSIAMLLDSTLVAHAHRHKELEGKAFREPLESASKRLRNLAVDLGREGARSVREIEHDSAVVLTIEGNMATAGYSNIAVLASAAEQFERAARFLSAAPNDNSWRSSPYYVRRARRAVAQAVKSLRTLGSDENHVSAVREAALDVVATAAGRQTTANPVSMALNKDFAANIWRNRQEGGFGIMQAERAVEPWVVQLRSLADVLRRSSTDVLGQVTRDAAVLAQLREACLTAESTLTRARMHVDDLAGAPAALG